MKIDKPTIANMGNTADPDDTLAADSDDLVASQQATKAFVLANKGVASGTAIAYAIALG